MATGERWTWRGIDWNQTGSLRVHSFVGRQCRSYVMEIEDLDGDAAVWRIREIVGPGADGRLVVADGECRDEDEAAVEVRHAMNQVLGYLHFDPHCGRPADQS